MNKNNKILIFFSPLYLVMVMPESERKKLYNQIGTNTENKQSNQHSASDFIQTVVEAAKEEGEIRAKIAELLSKDIDKVKFKEKLLEAVLKDPDLRRKILLEVIRKIE